jgi:recombination protein RecA
LDLGVQLGIIEKRGSFYLYKEDRLAQGRETAKQALRENPALCLEIENAIRRQVGTSELERTPTPHLDDGKVDKAEDLEVGEPGDA